MNVVKSVLCTICVSAFQSFNYKQYSQIYSGFRTYNLTQKQVKVYAKNTMSAGRMRLCKRALSLGFSKEELQELIDMNLNGYIFRYAVEGRLSGIPKEKVLEYSTASITPEECFSIYIKLLKEHQ